MKCLQGASALDRILAKSPAARLRVFVVWERVLQTDWNPPATAALARIADRRAAQFWDAGRVVSKNLGETSAKTKVWDWIAIYPPGTRWDDALPNPAFSGRPVEDVAAAVEKSLP